MNPNSFYLEGVLVALVQVVEGGRSLHATEDKTGRCQWYWSCYRVHESQLWPSDMVVLYISLSVVHTV